MTPIFNMSYELWIYSKNPCLAKVVLSGARGTGHRRGEYHIYVIGLEFCEKENPETIYIIQVYAIKHKGVEIRKFDLDSYNMIFEFTNLVFNLEKLLY